MYVVVHVPVSIDIIHGAYESSSDETNFNVRLQYHLCLPMITDYAYRLRNRNQINAARLVYAVARHQLRLTCQRCLHSATRGIASFRSRTHNSGDHVCLWRRQATTPVVAWVGQVYRQPFTSTCRGEIASVVAALKSRPLAKSGVLLSCEMLTRLWRL